MDNIADIREQALPFQPKITEDEIYDEYFNPVMLERLRAAEEQVQAGEVIYKAIQELEAFESD